MTQASRPEGRVVAFEPGKDWHGVGATIIEHCDMGTRTCKVILDRLPLNWIDRRAWFGFDQLRRPDGSELE